MSTITEIIERMFSQHKSQPTGTGTNVCKTAVKITHINTLGEPLPQGIKVVVRDEHGNKIEGITDSNGISTHSGVHCGKISWRLLETGTKLAKGYDLANGRMLLNAENTITGDKDKHKDPKNQENDPLKITIHSRDIPSGKAFNEITATYTQIYLVIGFEVNVMSAFKNNTQNLDVDNGGDYGHAFFFTVQDNKVITFFSFGPDEQMTTKGQVLGVRGRTNYPITEITNLFKFIINKNQLNEIKSKADRFKLKVKFDLEKYKTIMNDTCAETAKQVLDAAGIDTPAGTGYIRTPYDWANEISTRNKFVNPYSWFTQIKKKYGNPLPFDNGGINIRRSSYHVLTPWILKEDILLNKQKNLDFKKTEYSKKGKVFKVGLTSPQGFQDTLSNLVAKKDLRNK